MSDSQFEIIDKKTIKIERRSKHQALFDQFAGLKKDQALKVTIPKDVESTKFVSNIRQALVNFVKKQNAEYVPSIVAIDEGKAVAISKVHKKDKDKD